MVYYTINISYHICSECGRLHCKAKTSCKSFHNEVLLMELKLSCIRIEPEKVLEKVC